MKRFTEQPISTILGLFLFFSAFILLFIKTNYEIPLYALAVMMIGGILLLFAKDKFLDILTLGLSRFIQDRVKK